MQQQQAPRERPPQLPGVVTLYDLPAPAPGYHPEQQRAAAGMYAPQPYAPQHYAPAGYQPSGFAGQQYAAPGMVQTPQQPASAPPMPAFPASAISYGQHAYTNAVCFRAQALIMLRLLSFFTRLLGSSETGKVTQIPMLQPQKKRGVGLL